RALAGRLPFEGTNAGMIIALKLDRPAPSLSEVTDERWPAGLERFLARALQRDPELRHPDAAVALEEWRSILPQALTRRDAPPPERVSQPPHGFADDAPTPTDAHHAHWDGMPTATEVGDGFDVGD
ncbi:MAG: hypothetical protein KC731_25420, partial [Myxococcales bacterium]|nr:hypothetical protein [Myxococcales bacterium]